MRPRIPSINQQKALIESAFESLGARAKANGLFSAMCDLFAMTLNEWQFLHPKAENPIVHHPMVLKHAMDIAQADLSEKIITWQEIQQLAAVALLHDICPAQLIAATQTNEATTRERKMLERARIQGIKLHMKHGARMAAAVLRRYNTALGTNFFRQKDIKTISAIIAIHDNPDVGKIIPFSNRLAVIIREADLLWMLCERGVLEDLLRATRKKPHADINPEDQEQLYAQALKNRRRFEEERQLYDSKKDGPFCDEETCFRTERGHEIFRRYWAHWEKIKQGLEK